MRNENGYIALQPVADRAVEPARVYAPSLPKNPHKHTGIQHFQRFSSALLRFCGILTNGSQLPYGGAGGVAMLFCPPTLSFLAWRLVMIHAPPNGGFHSLLCADAPARYIQPTGCQSTATPPCQSRINPCTYVRRARSASSPATRAEATSS